MDLTVEKLGVNEKRLRDAMTPEIYATDRAFELVAEGMPFRDAYREVGRTLDTLASRDPSAAIAAKKSTGATGNLRLDIPRARAAEHEVWLKKEEAGKRAAITRLVGRDVELFRDPLG
jgi:argininosuccinate lyase